MSEAVGSSSGRDRPEAGHRVPPLQIALSSAFAGAVIALSAVITGIGVAALALPGGLQPWLFTGVGAVLFSAIVYLLATAWGSSYPGALALPQEAPAAVIGLMLGALAPTLMPALGPGELGAALLIAAGATTVLTGIVFYTLGRLRLGGLIRFIPYPVVGGVLAGLGWLLVKGGVSILTGIELSLDTLGRLAGGDNLVRLGVGAAIGLLLFLVTRRVQHFLILPGLLLGCVAAFYAAATALGADAAGLMQGGWLLGPFPEGPAWRPPSPGMVATFEWGALAGEFPAIATTVLVATISILLYASGIELAVRRDMDLNRELRVMGLGNCLAGLAGGLPGFHSMSDTILAREMQASRRLTGVLAAAMLAAVLFGGFWVLAYFPKPVLGGLLFFLGLSLLVEWVYGAFFRLPRADYLIVMAILVVAGTLGYLEGIGVGIVAGVGLFVVNYSRLGVTRFELSGASMRSNVDRTEGEREILARHGDLIQVFALEGFLFFGSANAILEKTRRCAAERPLEHVILDFRQVTGLDSSSLLTLRKLDQFAGEAGFTLVLSAFPEDRRAAVEAEGIGAATGSRVRFMADLDHALEWCEEHVLGEHGDPSARTAADLPVALAEGLAPYLETVELGPGTVVMRQGEASQDMYFLRSGRVTVRLEGGQRLKTYGPGTIVGEVAMFLDTPRSATVVTTEQTTLHRLTRADLDRMTAETPSLAAAFHRYLVTQLCERVVHANALVQSLV